MHSFTHGNSPVSKNQLTNALNVFRRSAATRMGWVRFCTLLPPLNNLCYLNILARDNVSLQNKMSVTSICSLDNNLRMMRCAIKLGTSAPLIAIAIGLRLDPHYDAIQTFRSGQKLLNRKGSEYFHYCFASLSIRSHEKEYLTGARSDLLRLVPAVWICCLSLAVRRDATFVMATKYQRPNAISQWISKLWQTTNVYCCR